MSLGFLISKTVCISYCSYDNVKTFLSCVFQQYLCTGKKQIMKTPCYLQSNFISYEVSICIKG